MSNIGSSSCAVYYSTNDELLMTAVTAMHLKTLFMAGYTSADLIHKLLCGPIWVMISTDTHTFASFSGIFPILSRCTKDAVGYLATTYCSN